MLKIAQHPQGYGCLHGNNYNEGKGIVFQGKMGVHAVNI